MRRKEAEALLGQRMLAWTALNGVYVGTLESVLGSPWRGVVRITGILEPAMHLCNGQPCRRGFRVGEILEVGGSSIRPTEAEGHPSYLDVLEAAVARSEGVSAEHVAASPQGWIHAALVAALRRVIVAERRRLEDGTWVLS